MIVKLGDIINGLEQLTDENLGFMNVETGEVIIVLEEELKEAEEMDESDNLTDLPEWKQENFEQLLEILEYEDDYLELPSHYEIDEYDMIEDFCYTLKDEEVREDLFAAVNEKDSIRCFKEKLYQYDLQEQWFRYKNRCYRDIAREWCEQNNINYED